MSLKAIIFDFDGSILDTETPDLQTWQEVFEEHGATLALEVWYRCIGTSSDAFDVCAHLEELVGRELAREEIRLRKRARCLELILLERPRPGVERWLDEAERLGLAVGIASSSDRAWVEEHLGRHGLLDRFRCLRTREDVARGKPAPDLYLAALEALGAGPEEAIAVEDSPNGVTAAKAAGLYCVAVPNSVTQALCFDHADLVVESLESVTIAELAGSLNKAPPVDPEPAERP